MIQVLDLNYLDIDQAIASFLVESSEGPILIETGPHSTFESLKKGLMQFGYTPRDVKHVLLTHIHFDHAGAAWALAETGANIYVHPFGLPHMEDPTKLYESAKRIYQDDMERLWGAMNKIPRNQLFAPEDKAELTIGGKTFIAHYTPGHAKHHIAWQLDDSIFSGDVAGVKIGAGPVVAPCPPPDIDLEIWNMSIDHLLSIAADNLYLTHFGVIKNKVAHLDNLRKMMQDWAGWVKEKWSSGLEMDEMVSQFKDYTVNQLKEHGVDSHGLEQYEAANPSWMSVSGLVRYWKKQNS
ncbi:MBL fold metallo-hydrolase [Marinoscillum sp. MHG1-6]|uniref:MBL fold metallo-hydrolase n=1 Tax=Marinoscillum sp. MHG1-6 TaxID=2959627 RepID=UPI002157AB10|nr:MBL fold metallo-hydrolase [Marinoscillum sp. MHG1-6]